jgi:hypothetical protein
MSSAHQKYLEWSPGRIMNWGLTIGEHTSKLLKTIMDRKPHPEMGYRSCLGVMRAYEKAKENLSEEQLDVISAYALKSQKFRLQQIKELLNNPPHETDDKETQLFALSSHENIRGSAYYQ